IRECLAFKVLHDQVGRPGVLTDVVQRTDMRMFDLRNRASLALESLTELSIGGKRWRKNLDGDGAIEPCIAGLVHFAHAAGTNQRQDLVRAKTSSGVQSQWRVAGIISKSICATGDSICRGRADRRCRPTRCTISNRLRAT